MEGPESTDPRVAKDFPRKIPHGSCSSAAEGRASLWHSIHDEVKMYATSWMMTNSEIYDASSSCLCDE